MGASLFLQLVFYPPKEDHFCRIQVRNRLGELCSLCAGLPWCMVMRTFGAFLLLFLRKAIFKQLGYEFLLSFCIPFTGKPCSKI